ncbi:hypothetical protein, partial [Ralstonia pseudosolanacearum]|uniref:hypothetical protein n=1 Tax=Ralstonia pseudosolanacearum TaxID=1310165 RepID=UPI003CFA84B6
SLLVVLHTTTTDNLTKSTSGKLIDTSIGDKAALDYAKKNLSSNDMGYALPSLFSVAHAEDDTINSYAFKDGYTRGDPTVMMKPSLWQDGDGNYYYVLHLTENIHHFFIGFLPDMNAGVVSVALISKGGNDSIVGGDDIKITFKPRGGTFNDGSSGDVTKTYKDPANLTEEDDPQLITTDKGKPT